MGLELSVKSSDLCASLMRKSAIINIYNNKSQFHNILFIHKILFLYIAYSRVIFINNASINM
jgi:hypothetical protein